MANNTVGTVQIVLSAVDDRLRSVFKGAERVVSGFGSAVEGAARRLNPFNAIIGAVSVAAVGAFVRKGFEAVDAMSKQSAALGITTQAYAGLKLSAADANITMDDVASGLRHVNKTILEAKAGGDQAANTLAKLSLTASDLAGLPADQKLGLIADRLNTVRDKGDRAAIAMELFGKEAGQKLAMMLDGGSAALSAQMKDAEALGLALSEVDAKQVENANDALGKVWEVIDGISNRIAVGLSPLLQALAEKFLDNARATHGFADVVTDVVEFAIDGGVAVYDSWQRLVIVWKDLEIGMLMMGRAAVDALNKLGAGAKWAWDTLTAFGASWRAGWLEIFADLNQGWAGVKMGLGAFAQWAGRVFANLLENVGSALQRVKGGIGIAMQEGAAQLRAATGSMAGDTQKAYEVAAKAADDAAARAGAAFSAIADVQYTENDLMQGLSDEMGAEIADREEDLQRLANARGVNIEQIRQEIAAIREQKRAEAELGVQKQQNSQLDASTAEISREAALREQRRTEATIRGYQTVADNLEKITEVSAQQSKAGFRVHQAAAIASATVNAWMAYSQALAAQDTPTYLKQAMAATALGAGLAAVSQIASQHYEGREAGGSVSSGGMYQVGEHGKPELLTSGGKNYLIMGDRSGHVTPAGPGGGASAAPKIEMHVHTPAGTAMRTQQSTGDGGAPRIDVIIEAVESRIAGNIAQGSSPVSRSMERTYGLNRSRGAVR